FLVPVSVTILFFMVTPALIPLTLNARETAENPTIRSFKSTESPENPATQAITSTSEPYSPTSQTIESASELDYPPFAVVRPDGSADGFSVELLKAVTKAVGMDVNIRVGPWHEIKQSLADGNLDVLPLVAWSQEREKLYDFSAPYLRMSKISVFVRKGETSIRGYADLKGKDVLVMRGDTAHEYAVDIELSDKLILTETFEDALKRLSKGEHDAVIVQQLVGLQLIKKLGISNIVNLKAFEETNLKPASKNFAGFEQKFCFAVRQGDIVLLGLLNEGLAIVFADGTYQNLYNKWFAPLLPQTPVPVTTIIKYMLFILVPLTLVIAIAGIWFLRREIANKSIMLEQEMQSRQHADTQYFQLFDKMLDGFALHEIICDAKGNPVDYRFLAVNPAFEKITGLRSADITGKRVLEVLPDTEPYWIDIYGKVALRGKSITFENYARELKRHFAVSSYQTEYMRFACILQDITDKKNSMEKEEKLTKQLHQAQKLEAIGTLAGGISHDFNNILSPILGHTEILLDEIPQNSQLRDSLIEINRAALRARELVKQILTFSRQGDTDIKLMKIQPVIKEALKLVRSSIPATIDIRQNIVSDCGAVMANPIQIHQIVMNLVTNSYHAMEETGGDLSVSLDEIELGEHDPLVNIDMPPGTYALLSVSDTGKGMSPDVIAKAFDPFFTTKAKGKGTGLGLSVVHGIVKSMNGAINVYSEADKGTRFNIYLPVLKKSFKEDLSRMNEPLPKGTGRILLVDDEESIAEMEKRILERIGYEVVSRVSSIEALEAFRSGPDKFDLVITDMAMPKMSGDKLAAELIKIRHDIPILLCTGFSYDIAQENLDALGIRGILRKPVIMKDLAKKIREVIEKKLP
ncbi:MAG: transporter substrate-binding domain-containing protein, partial [Desulfamplus sp.]|nr:transporter substrate-binding domain-containing protein [Desulfamplus sp.]